MQTLKTLSTRVLLLRFKEGDQMKRIFALFLCLGLAISPIWADASQAYQGPGNNGFYLMAGYDGNSLNYKEYDRSGAFADRDTGWQNGFDVQARYETNRIWLRGLFEYSKSNDSKYKGTSLSGVPMHLKTPEDFYRYEFAIGYKILNIGGAALTPYVGIGYRDWRRGENALPDYLEKYTWGYVPVGLNYVSRFDRWTIGADVALQFPFNMDAKTDMDHAIDSATFHLKARTGFRAELPVSVDISKSADAMKVFGFLTPYYQHWGIGASNDVTVTSGGVPVGILYEPKSDTNIFGFQVGIGVNF